MQTNIKTYIAITASYWAFTLTDGALRMLVLLYFHQLGYSPLEVASLFLFYEFFGVVTNLLGGYLGSRFGLNRTMQLGLALQLVALGMLCVSDAYLGMIYVMVAQALSGIAKDLNKMSAKSSIKSLVSDEAQGQLYRWVALLTGSKNALKGVGFFIGAALLASVGFQAAMAWMLGVLSLFFVAGLLILPPDLGRSRFKPKFKHILSKSSAINRLSVARMFLFASRDVWFVVALPLFLYEQLGWGASMVGAVMALWIIAYGLVQGLAPKLTGPEPPDGRSALRWALLLSTIPAAIALSLALDFAILPSVIGGLLVFGLVFAVNSSLHSYLIVSYADKDGTSLDIGFYYMANAMGRLAGTLLSGWVYQSYGLSACLLTASLMLLGCCVVSVGLPKAAEHP